MTCRETFFFQRKKKKKKNLNMNFKLWDKKKWLPLFTGSDKRMKIVEKDSKILKVLPLH